ncbi:MAG: hypothetical protein CEN91_562 [Candidatus Berkelbacteria bacterium Licking1014_85]|uniref:Uncharacterized protein n=1 Tax=Candidatus Berkelbacteria bacterium Licking1014_85 TaxID=2017148 RepID=A0A554LGY2_9BACT|nr:MAG: hypothetical protein CEN91_562 [Candidatus Berkelbacteria bacterium Licking1014_85]
MGAEKKTEKIYDSVAGKINFTTKRIDTTSKIDFDLTFDANWNDNKLSPKLAQPGTLSENPQSGFIYVHVKRYTEDKGYVTIRANQSSLETNPAKLVTWQACRVDDPNPKCTGIHFEFHDEFALSQKVQKYKFYILMNRRDPNKEFSVINPEDVTNAIESDEIIVEQNPVTGNTVSMSISNVTPNPSKDGKISFDADIQFGTEFYNNMFKEYINHPANFDDYRPGICEIKLQQNDNPPASLSDYLKKEIYCGSSWRDYNDRQWKKYSQQNIQLNDGDNIFQGQITYIFAIGTSKKEEITTNKVNLKYDKTTGNITKEVIENTDVARGTEEDTGECIQTNNATKFSNLIRGVCGVMSMLIEGAMGLARWAFDFFIDALAI